MAEHENITNFKSELAAVKSKFEELRASADKLKNKHLADTIKAGIGRFEMALGHPDIDLLSDDALREEAEKTQAQRDAEIEAAARADKTPSNQDGKSFPFGVELPREVRRAEV